MEKLYPVVSLFAILIPCLKSRWNEGGLAQSMLAVTNDSAYCRYETKIENYNFGSLIRTDCKDEYSQQNSLFGMSFEPQEAGTLSMPELMCY